MAKLAVAQIVPILHFRADRFLYLPSLAFVGFCVESVVLLVPLSKSSKWGARRWRWVTYAATALAVCVFSAMVIARTRDFRTDGTLFRAELSQEPDYKEGLLALAVHYDRIKQFARAEPLYLRCLDARPDQISHLNPNLLVLNLSFNLLAQQKPREAYDFLKAYEHVVDQPEYLIDVRYNHAVAAYKLG